MALSLLPCSVFAQPTETLFSGSSLRWGGYGGPFVGFTTTGGNLGVLTGGLGAAVMKFNNGHRIHFGGGGYSIANNIKTGLDSSGDQQYLTLNYGGFLIGYTNRSHKVLHFTTKTLIGGGQAGNRSNERSYYYRNGNEFFVLDPSVALEINVTKIFRISTGVHYRFISGANHSTFSDAQLSGVSGVITFKFGQM